MSNPVAEIIMNEHPEPPSTAYAVGGSTAWYVVIPGGYQRNY